MRATPAWIAALEGLLNRGIEPSAEAAVQAKRLEGTALRIDVSGVGSLRVSVTGGRLSLIRALDTDPADAVISGAPAALLALARGPDGARGSAPGAQVRGDAEIANGYRRLFLFARPDFEEELSRWAGDLPARRLSQFVRGLADWGRGLRDSARANMAEYLQEESRSLVNRTELDEFLLGVDSARESADRLAARLARLEQRLKSAT
jgi:ubiquinone biosynthesis protein UbiJ